MTKRRRRNHSPAFKAKVALAAAKGEKALAPLSQHFAGHPNQITTWRGQLMEGAAGVFGSDSHAERAEPVIDRSHALPAHQYLEAGAGGKVHPYLLRKLAVTRPNQVWSTDITTSRWRAASSTSSPSSTGSAGGRQSARNVGR